MAAPANEARMTIDRFRVLTYACVLIFLLAFWGTIVVTLILAVFR
jgi:hypothetical protein